MRTLENHNQVVELLQRIAQSWNFSFDKTILKYHRTENAADFYSVILLNNFTDEAFVPFGKTVKERKKNISLFLASDLFKMIAQGKAGTTLYDDSERFQLIKENLPQLWKEIKNNTLPFVLIYSREETSSRFFRLLFHEYLHILVKTNNKFFKNDKEKELFIKNCEEILGLKERKSPPYPISGNHYDLLKKLGALQ